MASKLQASVALLVVLNLLFFSMVSCKYCPPPPVPKIPSIPTTRPAYPPGLKYPACPRDTLKLGACANVLNGLINVVIGTPPKSPCCSLLQGLADVDAAACLCTAIKANILGINLNVPVSLSLLLNYCGRKVPAGFQCA